jgi:hypothetical protein
LLDLAGVVLVVTRGDVLSLTPEPRGVSGGRDTNRIKSRRDRCGQLRQRTRRSRWPPIVTGALRSHRDMSVDNDMTAKLGVPGQERHVDGRSDGPG